MRIIKRYISKYRRVAGNHENKVLLENFSFLLVLKIVSYFFPIITLPYLSRVIGAEGFGHIAFAAAIIGWVQTVVDWGFSYTATRDVAKQRDDRVVVSRIFSDVLWARILLMIITALILFALSYIIPELQNNRRIIFITWLLIPGHILFPDWFFQAIERMKYITFFNVAVKTICLAMIFLFIKDADDYYLQPLFTAIGYLASGTVAFFIILNRWGYKLYPPHLKDVFKSIKTSTNIFINNIVPSTYSNVIIVTLEAHFGKVATGFYDAANKFIDVSILFLRTLSQAFFPFLSRKIDKHVVYTRISLLFAFFVSGTLLIGAPLIVRFFYTPEFADVVPLIRLCSVSVILAALTNIYGTNYLVLINKELILRNITVVGSLLGCLLGYYLTIRHSVLGACVTVVVINAIIGVSTMIAARHQKLINN